MMCCAVTCWGQNLCQFMPIYANLYQFTMPINGKNKKSLCKTFHQIAFLSSLSSFIRGCTFALIATCTSRSSTQLHMNSEKFRRSGRARISIFLGLSALAAVLVFASLRVLAKRSAGPTLRKVQTMASGRFIMVLVRGRGIRA